MVDPFHRPPAVGQRLPVLPVLVLVVPVLVLVARVVLVRAPVPPVPVPQAVRPEVAPATPHRVLAAGHSHASRSRVLVSPVREVLAAPEARVVLVAAAVVGRPSSARAVRSVVRHLKSSSRVA